MGYERQGIAWSSFPLLRSRRSLKPIVPLWATTATSRTAAVDEPASYLAAAEKLFRDACSFFSQISEASGLSLLCKVRFDHSCSFAVFRLLLRAEDTVYCRSEVRWSEFRGSHRLCAGFNGSAARLCSCVVVTRRRSSIPSQPHSRFFQRSVPCDEIGRLVDESTCHKALPLHRIPFPLF